MKDDIYNILLKIMDQKTKKVKWIAGSFDIVFYDEPPKTVYGYIWNEYGLSKQGRWTLYKNSLMVKSFPTKKEATEFIEREKVPVLFQIS